MKLIPQTDVLFKLTKRELLYAKKLPAYQYERWLELKRNQHLINTILSNEKYQEIIKD